MSEDINGSNFEIDKALKEFQVNSATEQVKPGVVPANNKASRMVRLVMKLSGGMIKEERHAEYVLLAVSLLFFASASYVVYLNFFKNDIPKKLPGENFFDMKMKNAKI